MLVIVLSMEKEFLMVPARPSFNLLSQQLNNLFRIGGGICSLAHWGWLEESKNLVELAHLGTKTTREGNGIGRSIEIHQFNLIISEMLVLYQITASQDLRKNMSEIIFLPQLMPYITALACPQFIFKFYCSRYPKIHRYLHRLISSALAYKIK